MASFGDRIAHAWNAFTVPKKKEEFQEHPFDLGASYGRRPDRQRLHITNERSIISSVYNRVAIDVAAIEFRHTRQDENNRFESEIVSGLNNCLTLEANIDQGARAFRQDIAMTLFDKGVLAIVPVDTSTNPDTTGSFEIFTLRVGEILAWFPRHVRVKLYNDLTGQHEEVILAKEKVAIVENPLYSVMNEPNSTLQRLVRKLNLLDSVDEQSGSGKLDLIIQLPYVIKSEARREQADKRQKDIEMQLRGSKYGIAYTDGTERITQLNRPAENNLFQQVEYLTTMLYGQLGITESVFDGTASEAVMLNYYNRTVEPIVGAISEALNRSFLTKTARTQGHAIEYFRDPFRLVPISALAEIGDKLTRNEILSSNEVRGIIGFKPSTDPAAEELRNKNLPEAEPSTKPDKEG